ncbi:MAG TPA: hypothetical protein VMF61_09200 [Candidatus Acidoferrales bacterium]|nr:hypothetical protein [Candidatus Acidoferrales bacterium]
MEIAFVFALSMGVALPFVAMAWALKRRVCPHCGGAVEPDEALVRMFTGR